YVNLRTQHSSNGAGVVSSVQQAIAELEKASGVLYDGMLVRILARELRNNHAQSVLP
nr:hypothetical protein [Terriglobales bacterium]